MQVRFSLPPNAYATMALRELTRRDQRAAPQYHARRAAEAAERAAADHGAAGPAAEGAWERAPAGAGQGAGAGEPVWRRAGRRMRRKAHVPDWRLGMADAAAQMRRRPGARPVPRAGAQVAELAREAWAER